MEQGRVVMKCKVKKKAEKKFRQGYPLILAEDLEQVPTTHDWVTFLDSRGQYLATGYLSPQNKGAGWLLDFSQRELDEAFFVEKMTLAKEKRQPYYLDEGTSAFRLFNGEGDGVGGLTIELYQDFAVFSWYNETLYHKRQLLVNAFQQVFPEVVGAYEKIRFKHADLPESQHLYGADAPEPLLVQENFVNYAVYLNEGLMTGIFLDQKEVRGRLSEGLASGLRVLNMFSYTGAFSVASAMGGALATTSVDLAKRSLEKTREQFRINGIDPLTQKIHVMDVFSYFAYARKKDLTFDLIILDPPSFARNKKQVFTVQKNYGELVADSLSILADQGLLIASTNAANLSVAKFKKSVEEQFQLAQVRYRLLEEQRLPGDFTVNPAFTEGNYLKVFIYEIKK